MNEDELFENLNILKQRYTFDKHKEMVFGWEKEIRKALVIDSITNTDAIKKLVVELQKMINEMTEVLSWDETLTDQERTKFFIRRDAYQYLLSFFKQPKQTIAGISEKVEQEINNLK